MMTSWMQILKIWTATNAPNARLRIRLNRPAILSAGFSVPEGTV
jgi:hypothetical protein